MKYVYHIRNRVTNKSLNVDRKGNVIWTGTKRWVTYACVRTFLWKQGLANIKDWDVVATCSFKEQVISAESAVLPMNARWPNDNAVSSESKKDVSLVLRVCDENLTSNHGNFQYPSDVGAIVTAPDWDPSQTHGHGLHGWLWGQGDLFACGMNNLMAGYPAKWLVLEVETALIVELDGKVKFPSAKILFIGNKQAAAQFLMESMDKMGVQYQKTNIIGYSPHDLAYPTKLTSGYSIAGPGGDSDGSILACAITFNTTAFSPNGLAYCRSGNCQTTSGKAYSVHGTATAGRGGVAMGDYGSVLSAGEGGTLICFEGSDVHVAKVGVDVKANTKYCWRGKWQEVQ